MMMSPMETLDTWRHVCCVVTRVLCRHYEPLTETLALFAGLLAGAARVRVRGVWVTCAAGRVAGLAHAVLGRCRYVDIYIVDM